MYRIEPDFLSGLLHLLFIKELKKNIHHGDHRVHRGEERKNEKTVYPFSFL
jgi:hypothetical protein